MLPPSSGVTCVGTYHGLHQTGPKALLTEATGAHLFLLRRMLRVYTHSVIFSLEILNRNWDSYYFEMGSIFLYGTIVNAS